MFARIEACFRFGMEKAYSVFRSSSPKWRVKRAAIRSGLREVQIRDRERVFTGEYEKAPACHNDQRKGEERTAPACMSAPAETTLAGRYIRFPFVASNFASTAPDRE